MHDLTEISIPLAFLLTALALTLASFRQVGPATARALAVAGIVILFATQSLGIAITAPMSSATAGALERIATLWLLLALAIVAIRGLRRTHSDGLPRVTG